MTKMDEFAGLVEGCRPAAADALIDRVSGTEWATAEERYAAQGLVIRLERLRWQGVSDGPAPRPPPSNL